MPEGFSVEQPAGNEEKPLPHDVAQFVQSLEASISRQNFQDRIDAFNIKEGFPNAGESFREVTKTLSPTRMLTIRIYDQSHVVEISGNDTSDTHPAAD